MRFTTLRVSASASCRSGWIRSCAPDRVPSCSYSRRLVDLRLRGSLGRKEKAAPEVELPKWNKLVDVRGYLPAKTLAPQRAVDPLRVEAPQSAVEAWELEAPQRAVEPSMVEAPQSAVAA